MDRICPTQESLDTLRRIAQSVGTFHHHYHVLLDIARSYPTGYMMTYAEIGCYAGASACLVIQRPNTKVISIDIGNPVPAGKAIENVNRFNIHGNEFHYIGGNSHDEGTKAKLKTIAGVIDLLFIDGGHRHQDVILDFTEYQEFVAPGGYIVFDDYADARYPGVQRAIDLLAKTLAGWDQIGTFDNKLGARGDIPEGKGNCYIMRRAA